MSLVAVQSDNMDLALGQNVSALAVETQGASPYSPREISPIVATTKDSKSLPVVQVLAILLMICLLYVVRKSYLSYLRS